MQSAKYKVQSNKYKVKEGEGVALLVVVQSATYSVQSVTCKEGEGVARHAAHVPAALFVVIVGAWYPDRSI